MMAAVVSRKTGVLPSLPVFGVLLGLLGLLAGCAAAPPARESRPPEQASGQAPGKAAEEDLYGDLHDRLASGDARGTLEAYERALPREAMQPQDRLLRARLQMLAGDLEGARRELESLREQSPRDAEVLFSLAMVEGVSGNHELEGRLLDQVLQIDAGHPQALAWRGELYLAEDKTEEAERLFERALERDPDLAAALVGLADIRRRRNLYPQARQLLDRALQAQPDLPSAWLGRARLRKAQEDYLGAIEDLSEAIRLDPQDPWSYLERGALALKIRKREQAHRDFSEAIRLNPQAFAAYVYRAGLNDEAGRLEEAVGDYEQAIRLKPDYPFAYAPLGVLYYLRKDWSGAERMFRAAWERQPQENSLALLLYLSMRQGGRGAQARQALSEAVYRFPRASWEYDIGRYLLEPSAELYTLSRIEREKNAFSRGRMLFYVGMQALLSDRPRLAREYFLQAQDLLRPDFLERKIAVWLLKSLQNEEWTTDE